MCQGCWVEYGSPTELPEDGELVVTLIRRLYAQPDGSMGGPLHVVVDDWNLEDEHLAPYGSADEWEPETWDLAQRISSALRGMAVQERAAVLAYWGLR